MRNFKLYLLLFLLATAIVLSLFTRKSSSGVSSFGDSISLMEKSVDAPGVLVLELFVPLYYNAGGLYGGQGIRSLISQIDAAAKNDKVLGLLLRVNSPGGTVGASEEFYEAMMRFQKTGKPIVSSVVDLAASGGYYAILPSDTIMANKGSIIGSIGVRITTPDLTGLYKKLGVGFNQITSVKYKDILSDSRKMRPEEREHLLKMMKESHEVFVSDVVRWRKSRSSEAILRKAANGLIYSSAQAKKLGLIDKFGDFEAAKVELARLVGVDRKDLHFIGRRENFIRSIFSEVALDIKSMVMEALFNATPSASSRLPLKLESKRQIQEFF